MVIGVRKKTLKFHVILLGHALRAIFSSMPSQGILSCLSRFFVVDISAVIGDNWHEHDTRNDNFCK